MNRILSILSKFIAQILYSMKQMSTVTHEADLEKLKETFTREVV